MSWVERQVLIHFGNVEDLMAHQNRDRKGVNSFLQRLVAQL